MVTIGSWVPEDKLFENENSCDLDIYISDTSAFNSPQKIDFLYACRRRDVLYETLQRAGGLAAVTSTLSGLLIQIV